MMDILTEDGEVFTKYGMTIVHNGIPVGPRRVERWAKDSRVLRASAIAQTRADFFEWIGEIGCPLDLQERVTVSVWGSETW